MTENHPIISAERDAARGSYRGIGFGFFAKKL